MATEEINFKLLEEFAANLQVGKHAVEPALDPDLDFVMMAYKDYTNTTQKLLAKNQAAYVQSLRVNEFAGANGLVHHDSAGDIEGGQVTVAELNSFVSDDTLISNTTYNAFTVLAADVDDTPFQLTLTPSTVLGRASTGGIVALDSDALKAIAQVSMQDAYDVNGNIALSDGLAFSVSGGLDTMISASYDADAGGTALSLFGDSLLLKDEFLSSSVPLSESGETSLSTVKQSIIGAINEIKNSASALGRRLIVNTAGTDQDRGTDLLSVLADAKLLSPTESNPVTIYVPGANTYDIGSNTLNWDMDYIFFEGDLPAQRLTDDIDSTYANAIRPAGTTILSSNATATLTVDSICGFSNINFKNTGAAPCALINSASDTIYFDGCSGETTGATYAINKDSLSLSTVAFYNSHFELGINAGAGNLLVDSGAYGGTSFSAALNQGVILYDSIIKFDTNISVALGFVAKGSKLKGAFNIGLTTNFDRTIDDCDIDCAQLQFASAAPDDKVKVANSRITVSTVPIAAPGVLQNNFITSSASSGTGTVLVLTAASTGADNIIVSGNTINSGSETYSITASGSAAKPAVVTGNNCNKALDLDADEYSGVNFVNGATVSNLTVSDVNFPTLSTNDGDMTKLSDLLKHKPGRGLVSGGQISDGTNLLTQINVSAGYVWLSVNSEPGYDSGIMQFDTQTDLTVTPGFTNYVIAQWTASGVNIFVTLNPTPYLYVEDALIINLCFPDGDEIHKVNAELGWQSFNKLVNRRWIEEAEGQGNLFAKWIKGALIGSTGTRHMTVSEGVFWAGSNRQPNPAFDSNTGGDTMFTFYRDGVGGFTKTTGVTQYDNTSYDNGTGTLAPLASNRYTNLWCYIDFNADNISYQYDTAQYTSIALAEAATSPADRPAYISDFCVFIGRVVVQQGSDTVIPETAFLGGSVQTTPVTSHTQLSNLNADSTVQHMTEDEKTQVANTTANGLQGPYDVDGQITLANAAAFEIENPGSTKTLLQVISDSGETDSDAVNVDADAVDIAGKISLDNVVRNVPKTINLSVDDTTTTLTNADAEKIIVTGGADNNTIAAGNATTYYVGKSWDLHNASTEIIGVSNSDKTLWERVFPGSNVGKNSLVNTGSSSGVWNVDGVVLNKNRYTDEFYEFVQQYSTVSSEMRLVGGTAVLFGNANHTNATGTLVLGTGTGATGSGIAANDKTAVRIGDGVVQFRANLKPVALPTAGEDYKIQIGIFNTNTGADATQGVLFRYDRSTGFWFGRTVSGGTSTDVVSAIVPSISDTYSNELLLEVNSDASRVDFWVNKTHIGSSTTNIPSSPGYPSISVTGIAGSTDRQVYFDYIRMIRENGSR